MIRKIVIFGFLCGFLILLLGGSALAQSETPQVPSDEQETASGQVYFYLNGELTGVSRDVAGGGQMSEFAMIELTKGPTEEEKAAGYVTFIPEGVSLQYSTVKTDRSEYSVCLSDELLALNGDSETAAKALAQIEKTLQEVTGVDNIGITVAGKELGSTPQDAYEALGVAHKASSQTASDSSGGSGWLIAVIIILGVLMAGLLIFLLLFLPKRRKAEAAPASPSKASKAKK